MPEGSEEAKRTGVIKKLMRKMTLNMRRVWWVALLLSILCSLLVIEINVPAIPIASWWAEGTSPFVLGLTCFNQWDINEYHLNRDPKHASANWLTSHTPGNPVTGA